MAKKTFYLQNQVKCNIVDIFKRYITICILGSILDLLLLIWDLQYQNLRARWYLYADDTAMFYSSIHIIIYLTVVFIV